MEPESLLVENLPLVQEVIRFISRRGHCRPEEAEEFASIAKLKLVEGDYAVLRKFAGRSSLRTYLTVVLHRILLDYRTQRWGKWRPSAAARRLGDVAVRLERLIIRDGHSLDEACEILRTREAETATVAELRELGSRLPARVRRRDEQDDEALADSPSVGPLDPVLERERAEEARRAEAALRAALQSLAPQDRLILKLRFQEELPIAMIGRMLRLEEKALYRRVERLLLDLRASLQRQGLTRADVENVLGGHDRDWGDVFAAEAANPGEAAV